jgi:hypothetical protein
MMHKMVHLFGTFVLYNAVGLLEAPKDSVIDGGIICKHLFNILHGEGVLPNLFLQLILNIESIMKRASYILHSDK